jgi:hypothetical protein
MELVETRLYHTGETYTGKSIYEMSHFEILKIYSKTEAIAKIYSGLEQGAFNGNLTLLKIDITYESGTLYHIFNAECYYLSPQHTSNLGTTSLILPIILPSLFEVAILIIVVILAGYIIYNYVLVPAKEAIFGKMPISDIITWATYLICGLAIIQIYKDTQKSRS